MKSCYYFKAIVEAKKVHKVLGFNQSKWLKYMSN